MSAMPGTAHLVNPHVEGLAGDARCYRLDPPLDGVAYVTVFVTDGRFNTPTEAITVQATGPNGAALVMNRLPGSYLHPDANHAGALFLAGYALGADEIPAPPDPEVQP